MKKENDELLKKENDELLKKERKKEKRLRQKKKKLEKKNQIDKINEIDEIDKILKEVEEECKNNNNYKKNIIKNVNEKITIKNNIVENKLNVPEDNISDFFTLFVNNFKQLKTIEIVANMIQDDFKKELNIDFLVVGYVDGHKSIYIIFKKNENDINNKVIKLKKLIGNKLNELEGKIKEDINENEKIVECTKKIEINNNNIKEALKNNDLLFDIMVRKIKNVYKNFNIKNLMIYKGENNALELVYLLTEDNIHNKITVLSKYINNELTKLVNAKNEIDEILNINNHINSLINTKNKIDKILDCI